MSELTWSCHVCGRERPDAMISVKSRRVMFYGGVTAQENVRHCNDRQSCIDGAEDVRFSGKTSEVIDD